ncbi:hypothetical protein PHYSODRAFT_322182 [Phytophthora sojae]|uniref:Uncharacterized protein n=1 Tax=Phytophthora sojae (strain P6497) TaxID=1094619 RepID=G4YIU4_PHYSP|nr:hypothetical protein PHYSODRAFT_322182 [Phytophthora sojae]EGZ28514.1 hypothetical protein PHYSODRAFT_322182 [Phytophthora sojae]|eukprot:XP_009515789.1 hypothetical protein PHYSODRAFT_322182 [Phytophthora sojae]
MLSSATRSAALGISRTSWANFAKLGPSMRESIKSSHLISAGRRSDSRKLMRGWLRLGCCKARTAHFAKGLRVAIVARDALQADKEALQADKEALQTQTWPTPATVAPSADPPTHAATHAVVAQVSWGACREFLAQTEDIQDAYGHVRRDFDDLEAELRSLETEHDGLETVYGTLMEDHSLALRRIKEIASLAEAVPSRVAGVSPSRPANSSSAPMPPAAGVPSNIDAVVDPAGDKLNDDYACSDASTEPSGSDSETPDDEDLRVARARCRSDLRRRSSENGSYAPLVQDGSATAPIEVGDADTLELSDPAGGSIIAPSRGDPAAARSAGDGTFVPFGPLEVFIPGLRQQRTVPAADVEPWEPSQISILSMNTATPRVIIDYQVLAAGWMFPERVGRGGTLDRRQYVPGFITRVNVEALYAAEPWRTFENDCLPAIWESTHPFPITKELKRSDPWFSSFYTSRKNRSSHAREKCRNWQEQGFKKTRRSGCCDLDLWLDRMFARFPQQNEDTTWFPGREAVAAGRPAPTSLLAALADCDRADSWRNHLRTAPGAHTALLISRLLLKFSRTS